VGKKNVSFVPGSRSDRVPVLTNNPYVHNTMPQTRDLITERTSVLEKTTVLPWIAPTSVAVSRAARPSYFGLVFGLHPCP
jgi:hypothetical protein